MSDFNTIKNLYEDGYRCIYYDKEAWSLFLKSLKVTGEISVIMSS